MMPQNYRPGLDVVRLAALLPVLCYHYCIEAARLGFAVPTALIGRGMADWVEVGLAWFFLLSGAALCLQWQGRFDARRYFVGRAAATYPAFWLGFGALFLYGEVLHGNNADIPRWRVVFSVLGLDGYLAPVTVTFYKIGEWFLGVILILYLVFPLLLRCMETAAHRRVLALCMAVLAVVWPLVCPAPWEAGHTVLGRLPAFALGVWFGTLLKKNALPSYRLYIGLAVCPLLWVDEVPRLAVLLVLASVLFWAVYAAGQHVPAPLCPALRRLAGWCYGVYLVHHVLLTLVFLPFVQGHGLPLAGMFPVYLAASFVPAAVLTEKESDGNYGQYIFCEEWEDGYRDNLIHMKFKSKNESAPSLYMMRDSYAVSLVPFLKESFSESSFDWTYDFSCDEILDSGADVVVFEVVEKALDNLAKGRALS